MPSSELVDDKIPHEPYRAVLLLLLASAAAGVIGAVAALSFIDNLLLADLGVALVLATGCLFGILQAGRLPAAGGQRRRRRGRRTRPNCSQPRISVHASGAGRASAVTWARSPPASARATGGVLALTRDTRYDLLSLPQALVGAGACRAGVGLTATAVRYLDDIDVAAPRESQALARAGRGPRVDVRGRRGDHVPALGRTTHSRASAAAS